MMGDLSSMDDVQHTGHKSHAADDRLPLGTLLGGSEAEGRWKPMQMEKVSRHIEYIPAKRVL